MFQSRRTLFWGGVFAFVILAGAAAIGVSDICDYKPNDFTGSLTTFMNAAGEFTPSALIHAAQTDIERELGIQGQALLASTLAVYGCEGTRCTLGRLGISLAIDRRCPLPRRSVTEALYEFRLPSDRFEVRYHEAFYTLDQLLATWQDTPTPLDRALEIMVARVPPDFTAAYPSFTISLHATGDHWNVFLQPSDRTSTYMLAYQISYDDGAIFSFQGD